MVPPEQLGGPGMSAITVTKAAPDRDGLTLADLIQFVQDAQRAGVDPRVNVSARVGFRAQVLSITTGGKK